MTTTPVAAVHAPALAPAVSAATRSVSRADIMQLGQAGSPWAFLPVALRALRARSDDHELTFLVAAAFAKLMLVTPAAAHLAELPESLRNNEQVRSLRAIIATLPTDQILHAEVVRTCRANVRALAERDTTPIDLAAHVAEWEREASAWQWLKARDGNIVRRMVVGAEERWRGLQDVKGPIDRLTLPHAAEKRSGPLPPYILEGIDPPWLVLRVLRETHVGADGYHARVTIVQEDPSELLDGLAQVELAELLVEPRVRVIVGPGAGEVLRTRLHEAFDTQLAGPGLSMSTVRTPISPSVEACLQEAQRSQSDERNRLMSRVEDLYGARDAHWWRSRFEGARASRPETTKDISPPPDPLPLGGGGRLRVLIPTCRYSTFIKHSSADLAAAFERIGCEAKVLIEPDDHAMLAENAYLRTVAEFEPDLVVLINFARVNINGHEGAARSTLHRNIPYVMWIQDAMPHQLDVRVGASMGGLDFLTGNLREEYFQTFGYPRTRAFDAAIVASGRKFHDGEVTPAQRERFACEIAYVSHHSETPAAMHARKRKESSANPSFAALMERMLPAIGPAVASCVQEPVSTRLAAIAAHMLREAGEDPTNESLISRMMNMYAMPMADRVMRHQTLEWAARLCERRGWRLHLYGRGWEKHPTLAHHAHGELGHDDDLRACYRCATTHLQVSAHTVIHQRVVECALSGGLPLARVQADDLSGLDHWGAMAAARNKLTNDPSCDATDPWTIIRGRYRRLAYAVADCPETMAVTALRQRLGAPAGEFVWLNSAHIELMKAASADARALEPHRSLFRLFGDPSEYMFGDEAAMERLVARAVTDPDYRGQRCTSLRSRAVAGMTDESFADNLLQFITNRL